MDILEIAERKLKIVSKNQEISKEEQEMYLAFFAQDIVNNLNYKEAILNGVLDIRKR